jgi:NADH-quinone oxidoreductase subunit E
MSAETMSVFSPALAARFDLLVKKYPVSRSALVPMLLYAQDEVGYLSDAVVSEIAHRIGITELEVRNVASYYSMLRFKPAGRYIHVQVCTNISCMLRGAYDLYERFQEELRIGTKASRPTKSSRSKRSSASAHAAGVRPFRSTTTFTTN